MDLTIAPHFTETAWARGGLVLDELEGRFFAHVNHQLRTPLTLT